MRVKDVKGNIIYVEVWGYSSDDIQIESAIYEETGEEVEENVIDFIMNNYQDEMYEAWFEKQISIVDMYEPAYGDYPND